TITMDHAFRVYFSAYDVLQGLFTSIRYDLGVYVPLALIDAKHNRFTSGASSSFARNTLRAEVGFIDFNCSFQPMLRLGPMENFAAQVPKDTHYRAPADTAKFSGVRSGQIHREIPNYLPICRLRYF